MLVVLVLVLVLMPVLRDSTKMSHVSVSSKISAASSGSGVHSGARRVVTLSDLRRRDYIAQVYDDGVSD
jgi:hypothetical protein